MPADGAHEEASAGFAWVCDLLFRPLCEKRRTLLTCIFEYNYRILLVLTFVAFVVFSFRDTLGRTSLYFVQSPRLQRGTKNWQCWSKPLVLVYNRIPKAGSSTMIGLAKALAVKNGFRMVTPEPYYSHMKIRRAIFDAISTNTKTLIANHFYFPEIVYSNAIEYMNMMRDPVERLMSDYYYLRSLERRGNHAVVYRQKHGDMDIDQCIFGNSSYSGNCLPMSNLQTHFFCGMEGSSCHDDEHTLMADAVANMDTFYSVGITERFEDTLKMLEKRFPSFFHGALEMYQSKRNSAESHANTNEHPTASREAVEYLKYENRLDYVLYMKAQASLSTFLFEC